jgi:hypothetical protein
LAFLIKKLGQEVKRLFEHRIKHIVIAATVCITLVLIFTPLFSSLIRYLFHSNPVLLIL